MIANRRARRAAIARGQSWLRFTTSTTPPKLRRSLLRGASGMALAIAIGAASPALAVDECGVVGAGGTATCTPAGNNFPGGIQYQVVDLTIVVQDGVIIDTTGVGGEPGGIVSGGAGNYGDLVVKAGTGGGAGVTITTDGNDAEGVFVQSKDGGATITFFGQVTTGGTGAEGLFASGYAASISATGAITTQGADSAAISGTTTGFSALSITSTGKLSTQGNNSDGIHAEGSNYGAVVVSTGDISTKGTSSEGI